MKKIVPFLFAALSCAHTQNMVVYESDFSGDGRPEEIVLANTSGGVSVERTVSGLLINPGSVTEAGRNFVILPFDAVKLVKDGDFIALNFTLAVKTVPEQGNNIRFGLFDSRETRLPEDSPVPDPVELRDDAGYVFRVATHPESTYGNVSRYYVAEGKLQTAALTGNNGFQKQLGDENLTGSFLSNQSKKTELILTRKGDQIEFKVFFNGNLQTDGRLVEAPPTFRFDQAVFSISNPDTPITIRELIIESNGTREKAE